MPSRYFLFVIGARGTPPIVLVGAEFANPVTVRAAIEGQDSKRIEVTRDQWQFLRGVYAMNAEAPPGLPPGESIVFVRGGDDSDGLLLFVDGGKPGAPMRAPPALLSLLEQA